MEMDRESHNRKPAHIIELEKRASEGGVALTDIRFAQHMDSIDPLKAFRNKFHYPKMRDLFNVDMSLVNAEDHCVYLARHSHGLCPKSINKYMDFQLDLWAKCGVQGHCNGKMPWTFCDEMLETEMARIVGSKRTEVCLMNGLTINLHLLMLSFYQPTSQRYKILCEDNAFCSDRSAFQSEVGLHGLKPEDAIICLKPREGEFTLRTEDILDTIEKKGDQIAVVCFSGIQFYTGQFFDIPTITHDGHKKGCYVGWDLAHAVGNVPLHLHEWDVDFACWCTYKYLCGGAGCIAGAFVHEKHHDNGLKNLHGLWSYTASTRFNMDDSMKFCSGARAFRVSNPPVFSCAALKTSLEIFEETSVEDMRAKSLLLTGYMEYLIHRYLGRPLQDGATTDNGDTEHGVLYIDIISPSDPSQRGAQLSLISNGPMERIHEELEKRGVMCDVRLSKVLRVSPNPLFCSFLDIFRFTGFLKEAIDVCRE